MVDSSEEHRCPDCGDQLDTARNLYLHRSNKHGYRETTGTWTRQEKKKMTAKPNTIGRQKISDVGAQTAAGLACPKCGGTGFTAKRSVKGKTLGFATLGVAGLLAPKSQVKCVTCGTMFKRG